MKFHVIAGMPRSGSTLLCNVLSQNPRFFCSSTSCMAQTVRSLSSLWSRSPEIKSELINDREETEKRMTRAARALVEGWYKGKGEVVFDKGRFWNMGGPVLHQMFPNAKMLICVRDLRAIFASIEKQHARNPMLDDAGNPLELTAYSRADRLFSPNGMLGQQLVGIEDMLRRQLPYILIIQYETFVSNPQLLIDRIYSAIDEKPFEHDFENVENVSGTDVDGLYNCKFPHEGEGKVEAREEDWRKHVPQDIAGLVMQRFAGYNRAFGYQ
jgi:sulfotransferase